MQEYKDGKIIEAMQGLFGTLQEQGKKDVASGKADRFVIGELPKKGTTLVINGLEYIVFSVTGGTVVLKMQGGNID